MTRLACHISSIKGNYYHVAKNKTYTARRSIIIYGKHAKFVFYLGMDIIKVFRVTDKTILLLW